MARCLLIDAELPKQFWAYAVMTSVHICNRHKEPEQAKFWTGRLIRLLHWHQISLKGLLLYKRNCQGDYHALVSVQLSTPLSIPPKKSTFVTTLISDNVTKIEYFFLLASFIVQDRAVLNFSRRIILWVQEAATHSSQSSLAENEKAAENSFAWAKQSLELIIEE